MFEESVVGHIWYALLSFLSTYRESAIYNALLRAAATVSECFKKSVLHAVFTMPLKHEPGAIFTWVSRFVDALIKLFGRLYAWLKECAAGGICAHIYDAVSKSGYFCYENVLAFFFAVMFVTPHDEWNNLYAVLGAAFFTLWYVILILSGRSFAHDFKRFSPALLIFFVAIAASTISALDISDALRIALFMISAAALALCVSGSISSPQILRRFCAIICTALTITALFALYQNAVGVEVSLEYTDVYTNSDMPGRVYSTFANPNNYAELLVLVLPFMYALFATAKKRSARLFWAVCAAVCIFALGVTFSRSCYVALAIATVLFLAMFDWRLLIPFTLACVAAVPFLPASITNRISTIGSMSDTSNYYRLYVWEGVLRMLRDNIVTGIGIGPATFAKIYPRYAHMYATTAPHSHMLYLELFLETGVIGGVGFFAYLFTQLKKGLGLFNSVDKEVRAFIIAAIASMGGIAFVCAAEYIWFYPRVMFAFWLVIALLGASCRCGRRA